MNILRQNSDNEVAHEPRIEVDGIEALDAGGLRGICDVTVSFDDGSSVRMSECKVCQVDGKPPFAVPPQKDWKYMGSRNYKTLVKLDGPIESAFQDAVLGAWEVFTNATAA